MAERARCYGHTLMTMMCWKGKKKKLVDGASPKPKEPNTKFSGAPNVNACAKGLTLFMGRVNNATRKSCETVSSFSFWRQE